MTFADVLMLMGAAVLSSGLAEGISYVLIYSTDGYKRLAARIEQQKKKIERAADAGPGKADKKKKQLEEQLSEMERDMQLTRMKSMFAVMITMVTVFTTLNNHFDGRIVAKLPFEPFGFIQRISHRNLPGDDYTDCSFLFIYVLSNMVVRPVLQKILGVEAPKGMSSLFQPPQ